MKKEEKSKTKELKVVETEKNLISNICDFIKENYILLIFTIVITFLVIGSQLFIRNMRVDVQAYMLNPKFEYNWLEIGRFGAVLLKYVLTFNFFTPYFVSGLLFLLIIIANICFQFNIKKYTKNIDLLLIASIILIFDSPMYAEQFYFSIQYVEIVFAIILSLISVNQIFKYIDSKKIKYAIISIILMVIVFGTYQSFIPMYICLVTAMYLLYSINESKDTIKNELRNFVNISLKLIITFFIALILYIIISKYFIKSEYLNQNILWGKAEISLILKNILNYIKMVILGSVESIFYNKSYLVMGILLIITQIIVDLKKDIFIKTKNLLVVIIFLLTPFLLEIYVGQDSALRSQLTLPVTVALGFILIRELFIQNFRK